MHACFLGRLVPAEVVVAVGEVDVVFVEDGGPLKGCSCVKCQPTQNRQGDGEGEGEQRWSRTMQLLTCRAMAVF